MQKNEEDLACSQAPFYILQPIKNWSRGRPGNEASLKIVEMGPNYKTWMHSSCEFVVKLGILTMHN